MTNNTNGANDTNKLVVLISRGLDDERATIGWTLANAGITQGQEVTVFLVSAGVDLVRKGAADLMRMNPLDPSLKELIDNFMCNGGTVWACPPCANVRGYDQESFIDGVSIAGAPALYGVIKQGAATLCL